MPCYTKQRLIDFSIQFFMKKGILKDNARYISELVVMSEAMGFSTALWCEAGAALAGVQNRNLKEPEQSFSLLVIDPDNFAGRDSYLAEMKTFVRSLKESRPRPGKESVRLPGQRSFQLLKDAEEAGLHLDHKLLILLRELAEKNKILEFF